MRIDKYLAGRFGSRTKAETAVTEGLVLVNGRRVQPSYDFKEGDDVTFLEPDESYVSNGGFKLAKALKDFKFSVRDKIFADIGASNGGFTDCLLQNGAEKVYCIDVGESQLDSSLLDKNVVVIDNFNARNLAPDLFEERLDGAVVDVSFISLTYILPGVSQSLPDGAFVIALIKPQFECEGKKIGKNGIVKDAATHKKIIKKIYDSAISCSLYAKKLTTAPVKVGKNIEYLILLQKNAPEAEDFDKIIKYVKL